MHLLLVGDQGGVRRLLAQQLTDSGHEVSEASRDDADCLSLDGRFDLVLLTHCGGDERLLRLCRQLRGRASAPVILLLEDDPGTLVVRALRAGADDVICQPFGMEELEARIETVYRRAVGASRDGCARYTDEHLRVDLERWTVAVDGQRVKLSPTEYKLLRCFLERRGRLVSPQEAIEAVWGEGDGGTHGKLLSLYVGYLRRKLSDPSGSQYIRTKYGQGYWFAGPHDPEP